MNVVSIESMQNIDKKSIEQYGITSIMLMEYAGKNIFLKLIKHQKCKLYNKPLNIFCGVGGNGGDGLVVARYAIERSIKTNIYCIGDIIKSHKDFLINYNILLSMNVDIIFIDESNIENILNNIEEDSIVLDAIFGTGINKILEGMAKKVVEALNRLKVFRVAIDIPTALATLLEDEHAICFKADYTYTVGLPKDIFFKYPLSKYIGKLLVVNTLFPKKLLEEKTNIKLISKPLLKNIKTDENPFNSKREQGMLSIVAGSENYLGAALLASLVSYRLSLGYIRLYVVGSIFDRISLSLLSKAPEIVVIPVGDKNTKYFGIENLGIIKDINKSSACVFGCGIGQESQTHYFANQFVNQINIPTVIDADALYLLDRDNIKSLNKNFILTPHIYEYSKITNENARDILKEPYASLANFKKMSNASIILKDAISFAMVDDDIYINYNPTYGMGKAGMGDMFAGIIASMLAKGFDISSSIILSFYIQKFAYSHSSDIAKTNQPMDIIKYVTFSYNKIIKIIKGL